MNVYISQPGAAPTEMETQIAQKVEGSIASIGNVRNITTYIVEGQVNIVIEFQIGTPIDRAVTDVRDAVAKVRNDLPQGIMEPHRPARERRRRRHLATTPSRTTALHARGAQLVHRQHRHQAPAGRPRRRAGVAQRRRRAGRSACELDPARLQALGLTAVEVNEQLRALNLDAAGGRAQVGGGEQAIRVLGGAQIGRGPRRDTQIIARGGRSSRLREIADVRDGIAEVRSIARLNGRPATAFGVFKAKGASDVASRRRCRPSSTRSRRRIPPCT